MKLRGVIQQILQSDFGAANSFSSEFVSSYKKEKSQIAAIMGGTPANKISEIQTILDSHLTLLWLRWNNCYSQYI